MSRPPEAQSPFDYWWGRLSPDRALVNERGVVIDRLHLSEDIYGSLFRNGSRLTEHDRWVLEGWLIARGALVILCQPPLKVVRENVSKIPGGMYHGGVDAVYEAFQAPQQTLLPLVRFDYTRTKSSDINININGLPLAYPGIGSPSPRVVLVGDRHNRCNVKKRICEDPLVFRNASASGGYLRLALDLAGLTLRDYYIINGWRDDGTPTPLWESWLRKDSGVRFVALGREGARALRAQGVEPLADVGHPQAWRRFRFSQIDQYALLIKEAAA